jgi:hypothetical protein
MPFAAQFRTPLAALIFTATPIPNVADDAASSPFTSAHVSLHTADPVSGNQSTSAAAYTSYARQAVPREVGSFDDGLSDGEILNDAEIAFPSASGGTETLTHAGIGRDLSGTGLLFASAALVSPLGVATGVQPRFAVGAFIILVS